MDCDDRERITEISDIMDRLLPEMESGYKEGEFERKIQNELPELSNSDRKSMLSEISQGITHYEDNLRELNCECKSGKSKESWFAEKVGKIPTGVSAVQYGNYLQNIDNSIRVANDQMQRTILTKTGDVSQAWNLDGFIAEQQHVNSFNMRAALEKSHYRAEVCVPKPGTTYGKNSVDTVIKNTDTGKIVHRYQFKYGHDAKATIEMLKRGNYNNQRIVVPADQVAEVQKAFPGKTVTAQMGGTDQVNTASTPFTKDQAKQAQNTAQSSGSIPENSWNDFKIKELAKNLGKNAAVAGVTAAALAGGFQLAQDIVSGKSTDVKALIGSTLEIGADASIKQCVAGTLKVAIEKDIIKGVSKSTPVGVIVSAACVLVDSVKTLTKVETGELSVLQGIDQIGRSAVVTTAGTCLGMALGGALAAVPGLGFIGAVVGNIIGSKIGGLFYDGSKKIMKHIIHGLGARQTNTQKLTNRYGVMA